MEIRLHHNPKLVQTSTYVDHSWLSLPFCLGVHCRQQLTTKSCVSQQHHTCLTDDHIVPRQSNYPSAKRSVSQEPHQRQPSTTTLFRPAPQDARSARNAPDAVTALPLPLPVRRCRPPVSTETLAASSPVRPATSPPPPPAVLGTLLVFGPTIFDCMIRIQNKHI